MSEEEKKRRRSESQKKWNEKNHEKLMNYYSIWHREYRKTKYGRAVYLIGAYNQSDRLAGRGKGNLTASWIVENIFGKKCSHCEETDWYKMGCNRLDNSKSHTMDNVEPCCEHCNKVVRNSAYKKKVYQYTRDGEFIKKWDYLSQCAESEFNIGKISECCNVKRKTHKGYIWSYEPL